MNYVIVLCWWSSVNNSCTPKSASKFQYGTMCMYLFYEYRSTTIPYVAIAIAMVETNGTRCTAIETQPIANQANDGNTNQASVLPRPLEKNRGKRADATTRNRSPSAARRGARSVLYNIVNTEGGFL
jgi:hypothetical protein